MSYVVPPGELGPGWYSDPATNQVRWWDGQDWGEEARGAWEVDSPSRHLYDDPAAKRLPRYQGGGSPIAVKRPVNRRGLVAVGIGVVALVASTTFYLSTRTNPTCAAVTAVEASSAQVRAQLSGPGRVLLAWGATPVERAALRRAVVGREQAVTDTLIEEYQALDRVAGTGTAIARYSSRVRQVWRGLLHGFVVIGQATSYGQWLAARASLIRAENAVVNVGGPREAPGVAQVCPAG